MRLVLNVLSWSRVPLGVLVTITALLGDWWIALLLLVIAAITDLADGWVARRFNLGTNFGRDVVEPVCDGVLTLGALLGLVLTGVWPWWILVIIVGAQALLQIPTSFFGNSQHRFIKTVIRHQYWFTPFAYLVLLYAMGVTYLWLAFAGGSFAIAAVVMLTLVAIGIAFHRRDRLKHWLAGPK